MLYFLVAMLRWNTRRMLRSRGSRIKMLGVLRLAVGAGLIVAPKRLTGMDDPSSVLLVRTIGIRDLMLGAGTALASVHDAERWNFVTIASDSLDVIFGGAAIPTVGPRGGLAAALVPVPFVGAGIWAMRGARPNP